MNCRDYVGWTPLHEASYNDFADIVEVLIEHGANINDRGTNDCDGMTPLHKAADAGHINVITTLIRHGANVNSKTNDVGILIALNVKMCMVTLYDKNKNDFIS